MMDSALRADGSDVLLHVRVQPRASREAVVGEVEGRLRVALTAPPVEGAANDALRRFGGTFGCGPQQGDAGGGRKVARENGARCGTVGKGGPRCVGFISL